MQLWKSICAIHLSIKSLHGKNLQINRKNKIYFIIYRMPRCKNTKPETVDEVIEEMTTAEEEFKEMLSDNDEKPEKVEPQTTTEDTAEKKRNILIKLAEDGDLDKSVAYIKKASHKAINKLYTNYERKRMQKANEFLTDLLISRFSKTLGGLDAIESSEELSNVLKKDELLKRDVYSPVEKISPYIQSQGILSGGITTAEHIDGHQSKHRTHQMSPLLKTLDYFFIHY